MVQIFSTTFVACKKMVWMERQNGRWRGQPAYEVYTSDSMIFNSFLTFEGKGLKLISTHRVMKNKLSLREIVVACPRSQS